MFRSLLCLLFFTTPLFSQYSLGDKKPDGTPLFTAGWEAVPAPAVPMFQYEAIPGVRYGAWTFNEAGNYEVRNALVDRFHRAGAWSQPKALALKQGWQLWVNAANQPHDVRSCGMVWQVRKVGQPWELFAEATNGVSPAQWGSYIPTAQATSPRRYMIQPFNNMIFREGGETEIVAPPPDVISFEVPNVILEVAYSWITHNGETALSPVGTMPASTQFGATADANLMSMRRIRIGDYSTGGQRFPHGALGYYLYIRTVGGEWHRQPKRPEAANLDDFLWQPDDCYISVFHYRDDTPGPTPAANPQSYLSDFSRMLKYTKGDCEIDRATVEIYSPVVEEYEGREGVQTSTMTIPAKTATIPAGNTTLTINGVNVPLPSPAQTIEIEPAKAITFVDPLKQPYVGSETVQKFASAKGRRFKGKNGRNWVIQMRANLPPEANGTNTHPTYWPAVIVEGRGQWEDCSVIAIDPLQTGKRLCSAALAFRDYSGGQAFSCGFYRCIFAARNDRTDYRTQGVRVQWECVGINGHTASEHTYNECQFGGNVPIWMEHNQTANMHFTGRTYAMNYQTAHRLCPSIWIDAPLVFTFNELYTDNNGTIISLGWSPAVSIDYIFVDQQFNSLCDANNNQAGSLEIKGGQVNFRSPMVVEIEGHPVAIPNWLCRVTNTGSLFEITVNNFLAKEGPAMASSPKPNTVKFIGERTSLTGMLTIVEPTKSQWHAMHNSGGGPVGPIPGIVLPGQIVTQPASSITTSVTVNGQTVPVTVDVPAKEIVIPDKVVNGLTTSPQIAARLAWPN